MEISGTLYPTGIIQYVSEHKGNLTTYPNGTIYHQRDSWDDLETWTVARANEWLEGSTLIGMKVLDNDYRIVTQIGTTPEWEIS